MANKIRTSATRSQSIFSNLLLRSSPSLSSPSYSRSLATVAFEEVRVSEKPFTATALIIHGLLGSGRNWRTFSRNLCSTLVGSGDSSEWRMVLVDLRNHGKSAGIKGLDPPHDMVNAARDLVNLVKSQGWLWPDVVIGHSLGGKVAMEFVQSCASGDYGESATLPKQLWVLDSVPGEVNSDTSDGEVEKVLHTLQSLPLTLPSRKWLVEHMIKLGFSKPLSEWIGSNLKKAGTSGEEMTWTFDLEGAIQMFNSYREKSYLSLLESPPKGLEISLVRAENSDRWTPHVLQQLERVASKHNADDAARVTVHMLPKSGHWVHVDNPKGLIEMMAPHMISMA